MLTSGLLTRHKFHFKMHSLRIFILNLYISIKPFFTGIYKFKFSLQKYRNSLIFCKVAVKIKLNRILRGQA